MYGFNCGSGAGYIETEMNFNDGEWHKVQFSRQGERGKLSVDGSTVGEGASFGQTDQIEVEPEFFLGGLKQEFKVDSPTGTLVRRNLQVSCCLYNKL